MDNIDIDFGSMEGHGEETTRRANVGNFGSVDALSAAHVAPGTVSTTAMKQQSRLGRPIPPQRKGIWKVLAEHVPELPELHPLERAAVFIENEEPSAISERISGELRDRSIEAYYEEDVAKAKCTTPDGVDFRIRMYRGRGKYSHGIIVEVQRRFGVSTSFHTDTMAILDRAQGKEVPRTPFKKSSLPLVSDTEDDYEASGPTSLAMVSKMLQPPGHDSQSLGLQTLASLTDASKMGSSTAKVIAKELLKTGNEVGNKVLAMVVEAKEDDELFKLRTVSMTILANALQAVQGDIPSELREELEPVLLQDLRAAEKNQRAALQAARCVEWILAVDKQSITDFDEALKIAKEVGNARHAGLEKQAKKCLDKIV